jgi:hypothetical protein
MAEFEPNEWQKRALADIHVIDKPSEWGTCVHVYLRGKSFSRKPYNIDGKDILPYPISVFDPENNNTLPEELTQELVDKIREKLIQARPVGYAFRPTESEQLKIDRIFVELAKYPELSHLAFDERGLVILAGDDNFGNYYTNQRHENPGGHYNRGSHRSIIGDSMMTDPSDLR